ncbi:DNA polymerase III subunit delta' [Actinomycetota bacterium]|jgi:DNA polymerase III subunit delta'|nr:DNA polymerase III subunit delta' [Actinomycetota bacterium]
MQPIWGALVGQSDAVEKLCRAVTDADKIRIGEPGPAMTHAWLITGPPGSGRSTAATTFAAALMCPLNGCGTCQICRMTPFGGHPDVQIITPSGLSYGVEEARELVRLSAFAPIDTPWRVVIMEDADRLTDRAFDALLKSLEEPTPHTVWVLCAPSAEDVLPTIVSRTRHISLRTPTTKDVTDLLIDIYKVDPAMAAFAARASQGHIGRARGLATEEVSRARRQSDLRSAISLRDVPSCVLAAREMVTAAAAAANTRADELDTKEDEQLKAAFGIEEGSRIKGPSKRNVDSAKKQLLAHQKTRRTRMIRDEADRSLVDLLGLFRDVLIVQVGSNLDLINQEMLPAIESFAARGNPADTTRTLEAIEHARASIQAHTPPQLAVESVMVSIKDPKLASVHVNMR